MTDLPPAQAADRITALLAAHESRTLEFKRISARQKGMIESTCAFANSDGGLLVIGVGDAKDLKPGAKPESRLFGVEENAEAFDDFRRHVMQRFVPPMTQLHWLRVPCILHNGQPGHVMLLRVEKSEQVHSVVGNGTWTRMDASNRRPFDYYLFPRLDVAAERVRLAEDNDLLLDAYRFDALDFFYEIAAPVRVAEAA